MTDEQLVLICPDYGTVHDGDDFHPECKAEHLWGPWHFSEVGPHELRYCGRCGIAEFQEVE